MASAYPNLPYGVPYQDASEGPPTQQGVHDGSPMGDASIYQTSGSTSSDSSTIDSGSQPRKCSVRGCMTVIPTDTSNKMCEACRGRHRVYAMTKRAKRKLEKDSLVQQSVALLSSEQPAGTVWLPENPQLDEEQREPWIQRPDASVEPEASTSHDSPPARVYPATWDHSVIDPSLVSTQSSELAGALTLPSRQFPPLNPSEPPPPSEADTDNHDIDAPYVAPLNTSESSRASSSSTRPERPCSVKGCKATIPTDYYFKMCEPCRDRYRGYGITKRAKWRAERIAANAELEALRIEEDKRRAEEGLPPLSECPEDWITWQNDIVDGPLLISSEDKHGAFPTRMCTVSHCHVILSGEYKYRRCEQHRLQNRHHSKLKRMREKEEKAAANALVDAVEQADGTFQMWTPKDPSARRKDKDEEPGPLFTRTPMELDRASPGEGGENLLAPDVPWKMCNMCREHDRENRKNKKIREINKLPPLRTRVPSAIPKRKRKKDTAPEAAATSSTPSADPMSEPISAHASSSTASSSREAESFINFVNVDQSTYELQDNNTFTTHEDEPAAPEIITAPPTADPAPVSEESTNGPPPTLSPVAGPSILPIPSPTPEDAPAPKKRRLTKSKKATSGSVSEKANEVPAPQAIPSTSNSSPPVPMGMSPASFPYPPPPYPAHGQPPYPMHYYVPSPYYNPVMQPPLNAGSASTSTPPPPAQPGAPVPPPGSSPVPMYPYPYGYPPYAPRPFGQYPYPYPPYALPMGQPPPFGYGPPPAAAAPPATQPIHPPKVAKPFKRKPRKNWLKMDQPNPGPDGASFTSVFSAALPPTPTLRPISPSDHSFRAASPPQSDSHPQGPEEEPTTADVIMAGPEEAEAVAADTSTRTCGNHSCQRALPAGASGNVCERCVARMKKRQSNAKRRYKLEPKVSIMRLGAR
ncbi:hypothetical protein HWV62_14502 [Athelia sp. TMB]|nr:hypothetical protein HWV62_14502 [Athelia sp. TMB]